MKLIRFTRDLLPGDLMFGPIHGITGFAVGVGQLILAMAEPGMIWRQGSAQWWGKRHCGVIVEASRYLPPGSVYQGVTYNIPVETAPRLVQAMPGGIEEIDLRLDKWNREYVYVRPAYVAGDKMLDATDEPYYSGQGEAVAHAARSFVGRPYDFATYAAIPLYRRGIRTERIKRIISGTDTMMCSRTVDAALEAGHWHLFDDGRMPGNVTPSEVYRRVLQMPMAAISDLHDIAP